MQFNCNKQLIFMQKVAKSIFRSFIHADIKIKEKKMNIGSGRSVGLIVRETAKAAYGENLGERYAYVGLKRLVQAYKLSGDSVENVNLLKQNNNLEIVADAGKSMEEFTNNIKTKIQENPLEIFHQAITKVALIKKAAFQLQENKAKETELLQLAFRSMDKAENSNTEISLMTNLKRNFLLNGISNNTSKVGEILKEISKNEIHIEKVND